VSIGNISDLGIPAQVIPSNNWPKIPYKESREGLLDFRISDSESIYDAPAFFNPVMVLNRDLSILFARLYSNRKQKPIRVFEPLAGIGIRALRMALEAPNAVSEIVINDFDEVSTGIASYNIQSQNLENRIFLFKREARALTYNLVENRMKYHYIDVDPFGTPSPFIDSIWAALSLNALVSITATDMTALCGVYPKSCLRKYGSLPLNNHHTHETAARILISTVVHSAARHERGVKPIFTTSVDHYTKVFFEVRKGRGEANDAVAQIGYSYTCSACSEIRYLKGMHGTTVQCCGEIQVAGPLWVGEIYSTEWCQEALDLLINEENNSFREPAHFPSIRRMKKLFEEGTKSIGLHGYYAMDVLGRKLGLTQPKFKHLSDALEARGYRFVQTQFTKQSFRSDAPGSVIIEVIKELVEKQT
jgi:tRNA (guanine26-N2/guanine27-N2)-dimethyltransferase